MVLYLLLFGPLYYVPATVHSFYMNNKKNVKIITYILFGPFLVFFIVCCFDQKSKYK